VIQTQSPAALKKLEQINAKLEASKSLTSQELNLLQGVRSRIENELGAEKLRGQNALDMDTKALPEFGTTPKPTVVPE
jgi:hypothetical protein